VSALEIRHFLEAHGLRASRDLGQNFLIDPALAERLVALAGIVSDDAVIEIGTGLGILTRALAARARKVITLEVDAGLVRAHRAEGSFGVTVDLRHADALEVDLRSIAEALGPPVKLVANLPYSVSSPLLRRVLDLRAWLVDWSVMLQKEVADRLLAKPGSRDYGSLSVLVQLLTDLELCTELSADRFFPAPKVVSSFLRMRPKKDVWLSDLELGWLERVVRAGFGQRRKTLVNALKSLEVSNAGSSVTVEVLRSLGIDPRVRAEVLDPSQFLELASRLASERRANV